MLKRTPQMLAACQSPGSAGRFLPSSVPRYVKGNHTSIKPYRSCRALTHEAATAAPIPADRGFSFEEGTAHMKQLALPLLLPCESQNGSRSSGISTLTILRSHASSQVGSSDLSSASCAVDCCAKQQQQQPSESTTAAGSTPATEVSSSKPTAKLSFMVIEIFAGSYSAGRLAGRLNNSSTTLGIAVSAYAAVELGQLWKPPSLERLGLSDPNRCLLLNASITDPAVHGQLMLFVQRALQQSADGTGPKLDGIMLFGGPPCTNYTGLQHLNMKKVIKPDPYRFLRKQYASDRLVIAFLGLYSTIKALCASPRALHPLTQQPVPTCIVMENPQSGMIMNIGYTDDEIQASDGRLGNHSIKLTTRLNLAGRHFLQPYLVNPLQPAPSKRRRSRNTLTDSSNSSSDLSSSLISVSSSDLEYSRTSVRGPGKTPQQQGPSGGYLHITTHAWCSYASLTHPQKYTYIFSDLDLLQDTRCICARCRPSGAFSLKGVKVYKRHHTDVEGLEGGDGGHRATWPDAWLSRVAWLFSMKVISKRSAKHSNSSSSTGGTSTSHSSSTSSHQLGQQV